MRNVTDVDDKTIRESIFAGVSLKEFTDGWTNQFHEDCKKLNLLNPHIEPSAVEHIPEQIELIEQLIDKGNADMYQRMVRSISLLALIQNMES